MQSPPWPDAVYIGDCIADICQVTDAICFVFTISHDNYIVDFGALVTYYVDDDPPAYKEEKWVRPTDSIVDGVTYGAFGSVELDGVFMHTHVCPKGDYVFILSGDMQWIIIRPTKHN